ncbi:MAG: septal ring lytic transglycosylase RlpA family protein [Actinomycetota bacterium]|nr:septal ring lytic transglycosylase RlpA family protein [Actinomycetota bacterium]
MTPQLAQREVALAAVALLGAIVALALGGPHRHKDTRGLPQPVLVPGVGWYPALAGPRPINPETRTKCGFLLKEKTIGVTDPILRCGARIYVAYRDSPRVLTQVIDRGPVVPGRRFDLTPALADKLGVHGVQRIRWVFAR